MQVMDVNALGGRIPLGIFLQKDPREVTETEMKNLGQPEEAHTSEAAFPLWHSCILSRETELHQLLGMTGLASLK